MIPPALAARGLVVELAGRRALGPLDLEVAAGETVALIGPNGAGKTTLLRALAGLVPAAAGTVEIHAVAVRTLGRRRLARRLAYLPQQIDSDVPLRAGELVLLARYPHRQGWRGPSAADRTAAAAALAELGLESLAARPLAELSGGERRLVGLAAALAQGSSTWLLDEPTAFLDPAHQQQVGRAIERLSGGGRTVMLATHDLELAGRLAGRVLALRDGRLVAAGAPEEVLAPAPLAAVFAAAFELVAGGGVRLAR